MTFDKIHGTEIAKIAEANPPWVYSQITGCPLLGPGTYCYLTSYDTDAARMLVRLRGMVAHCDNQGIPALRQKIERIVYDTKTGVDEVTRESATLW